MAILRKISIITALIAASAALFGFGRVNRTTRALRRPLVLAQSVQPVPSGTQRIRGREAAAAANLYDPPPLPDPDPIDWPMDPPDPFTDPFDPDELPLPELPDWPPESLDVPFDDPIPWPDPPDIEDPFPDDPSLFSNTIGGEPLGYTAGLAILPRANALAGEPQAAVNVPTALMPFPMKLPFHPAILAGQAKAPATRRKCDPTFATTVLIPEYRRNDLYFLNTCTKATARVVVGRSPIGVVRIPDGPLALVSNSADATLSIVDLNARSTVGTITLTLINGSRGQPTGMAISPDGATAYVIDHADFPGSVIWVVDLVNRSVIKTLSVGGFPASIAITSDGSQVWVTSRADGNITVIDTLTNTALFSLSGATLATGVAFNPAGTRAYVAQGIETGGNILVYDTSTYSVVATIPVGKLPHAVAVTPTGRHVLVTNALSNSITQIDTASNKVVRTVALRGKHPLGLTFIQ